MNRSMTLALLVLFAGATMANERGTRVNVDEAFAAQRTQILEELGDGETYSEIKPADREKVQAALARISGALDQSGGVAQLDEQQKVSVFNDQELVNNILTEAGENSRLVCKRVKKTGSHMSSNQCMTVGARNRAAEHAQDELRRTPPRQLKDSMGR
ncbi:MAG: hypothetical protein L0H23_06885 [Luteimonas sp.]|nr:hypothetical protein [Luteimonas sp.]